MAKTKTKVSIALEEKDLEWVREHAREGKSISAVVTEAVRMAAMFEARQEMMKELLDGRDPPTVEEIAETIREWYA